MAPIVLFFVIPGFFLVGICRRFTGLERRHAALLWAASLITAGAVTAYRIVQMEDVLRNARGRAEVEYFITLAGQFLLVPTAGLLAGKLYHRWIGGHLTPEEKAPGADGVRAWLRGGNLIVAVLAALFAWLGYGCSFPVALMVTVGSLLAYPLMSFSLGAPVAEPGTPVAEPGAPVQAEVSAGRERVLKMVDEGKITPAESAALLSALGGARPAAAPGAAMTPARKLVCAGAVLVVVGFFLPWFSFNAVDEVKHGIDEAAGQLRQALPEIRGQMPRGGFAFDFKTPSIHRNGGEMPNGLGWIALVLAAGVAALPFVAAAMAQPVQRTFAFVALGVGAFVVVYLLMQDARHAGIGLILALAGYGLEFAGTLRDRQA